MFMLKQKKLLAHFLQILKSYVSVMPLTMGIHTQNPGYAPKDIVAEIYQSIKCPLISCQMFITFLFRLFIYGLT